MLFRSGESDSLPGSRCLGTCCGGWCGCQAEEPGLIDGGFQVQAAEKEQAAGRYEVVEEKGDGPAGISVTRESGLGM